MDTETLMLVGMGVVVLLLGLVAWAYTSRRRRVNLRERFGREYARTVEAVGPARAASVLQARAERVSRFDLDALVSQVVARLTEVFTRERATLEGQRTKGDNVSTEDLRIALTRYRSFFHRLLSM